MKIAILTKEFPPHIYGGAGVHAEYLSKELRKISRGEHTIHVLCFGDQQERVQGWEVTGIAPPARLGTHEPRHHALLDALFRDVSMVSCLESADIIHCHTWYTHLAGALLKQLLGAPLVLTTHSLEPHRPWKREQLDTAYQASSWIEKTAYQNADGVVAVSEAMKKDVQELYGVAPHRIQVIPNGIDEERYRPTRNPELLRGYGIDPERPFVLVVARLTRQKGVHHFLEATRHLQPGIQAVLCASAPDTPEILQETAERYGRVSGESPNRILWIKETVPLEDVVVLYSHAALFVCPSIYEPFGIVNLEAMACGTPVVASAVGGILEVVEDGLTGKLVPYTPLSRHNPEPEDPERFALDLADAMNSLVSSPVLRQEMGARARERVRSTFGWRAVAEKTLSFYRLLLSRK